MTESTLEQKIVEGSRWTIRVGGLVTGLAGTIGAIGAGIYHAQTGQPLMGKSDGTEAVLTVMALSSISAGLLSVSDPREYAGIPDSHCYSVPQMGIGEWWRRITIDETLSKTFSSGIGGALVYGMGYGIGKVFQ